MRFRLLPAVLGLALAFFLRSAAPATALEECRMWDPYKGEWVIENHGVDPDIEVENTPSEMVSGRDAQLERAIQWTLDELQKNPPKKYVRPKYKVQEGLR